MAIVYCDSVDGIVPAQLGGFFEGWPNPPSAETHLRLLQGSDAIVLALDDDINVVVGFITAVTDGVLMAFIPLLEVLPVYRGQGIGQELTRRLLGRLSDYYAVDLLCDPALQPFYRALGMQPTTGMALRRYAFQSGRPEAPV